MRTLVAILFLASCGEADRLEPVPPTPKPVDPSTIDPSPPCDRAFREEPWCDPSSDGCDGDDIPGLRNLKQSWSRVEGEDFVVYLEMWPGPIDSCGFGIYLDLNGVEKDDYTYRHPLRPCFIDAVNGELTIEGFAAGEFIHGQLQTSVYLPGNEGPRCDEVLFSSDRSRVAFRIPLALFETPTLRYFPTTGSNGQMDEQACGWRLSRGGAPSELPQERFPADQCGGGLGGDPLVCEDPADSD